MLLRERKTSVQLQAHLPMSALDTDERITVCDMDYNMDYISTNFDVNSSTHFTTQNG